MKILDGSPVCEDYLQEVSRLIDEACEAEEQIDLDETGKIHRVHASGGFEMTNKWYGLRHEDTSNFSASQHLPMRAANSV